MDFCADLMLTFIILTSAAVIAKHPCEHGHERIVADDTECQIFYDCSKPTNANALSWLSEHARECPYPEVFNTKTKKCDRAENVDCGSRHRHVYLCEYLINLCTEPLCRQCRDDFPACKSKNEAFSGETSRHGGDRCGYTNYMKRLTCPVDEFGKLRLLDSSACRDSWKLVKDVII